MAGTLIAWFLFVTIIAAVAAWKVRNHPALMRRHRFEARLDRVVHMRFARGDTYTPRGHHVVRVNRTARMGELITARDVEDLPGDYTIEVRPCS